MNTKFRRTAFATVGAIALLGVSACSQSNEPNTREEAGTKSTASSTNADSDNPPPVEDPKNLTAIDDACKLLTSKQLKQLKAAPNGKPDTTAYGESACTWSNDNFIMTVALNTTTNSGGAEIRKEGRAKNTFRQVKGYPALVEHPTEILCRLEVGVGKDQSFAVDYAKYSGDAPAMQDPCGYAEKIAAKVLENIPDA